MDRTKATRKLSVTVRQRTPKALRACIPGPSLPNPPDVYPAGYFGGIHHLVCVQMNLAEEAYQALKKAVSLDPNNAYYNYAMGAVALEREEPSEAILYFQKYCQLNPHDPRGRLALGSAYFASHDEDR